MALTWPTDTDDDGTGTTGTIHNNAWLQAMATALNAWAWDSYSPTWASSGVAPVLAAGTLTGRYMAIGKLYIVEIVFTPGVGTTFGTGNYTWTVPTAAAAGAPILGIAEAFDSGTGNFLGTTRAVTTTTFQVMTGGGVTTVWGQTSPMTWVTSADTARFLVAYRAA